MTPDALEQLLETVVGAVQEKSPEPQESFALRFDEKVLDIIPEAVTKGVFTGTIRVRRHTQLELAVEGLPPCLIAAVKRLATLANPVFYEKQRLRFPTYNIPRFIFCGARASQDVARTMARTHQNIPRAGGVVDCRSIVCGKPS